MLFFVCGTGVLGRCKFSIVKESNLGDIKFFGNKVIGGRDGRFNVFADGDGIHIAKDDLEGLICSHGNFGDRMPAGGGHL